MKLHLLNSAISAVAPIVGVSSAGVISFDPSATDEQRKAAQIVLDTWDPDKPSIADIKDEAQRRIIALTGATDLQSSTPKQLNALMRATAITYKMAALIELTDTDRANAERFLMLESMIVAIRNRSNELELSLPNDYRSDEQWKPV